eukprot:TRINITY_DN39872_c0_g1_i3.p2 TRINITY_DN39872_c0_g1~~TRINITY_DN39872_c0_g1_i3.p2  ORF type:complete len:104 (+),score=7.88 TRINITY_DN39872_c0_g1_i3:360-671(+)
MMKLRMLENQYGHDQMGGLLCPNCEVSAPLKIDAHDGQEHGMAKKLEKSRLVRRDDAQMILMSAMHLRNFSQRVVEFQSHHQFHRKDLDGNLQPNSVSFQEID